MLDTAAKKVLRILSTPISEIEPSFKTQGSQGYTFNDLKEAWDNYDNCPFEMPEHRNRLFNIYAAIRDDRAVHIPKRFETGI